MNIQASNLPTTTASPQLTPRAAHAVHLAKTKAEHLTTTPEAQDVQIPDALRKALGLSVPEATNSRIELSVDKQAGIVVGRVIDRATGEVIRQIPAESIVRLIEANKAALGPLVDVTT